MDTSDIRLIKNIQYNQTAVVRAEDMKTGEIEIQIGFVRAAFYPHNCLTYIQYSQFVFQKALEETCKGVNVGRTLINNLRFGDDITIRTESAEERVNQECEEVRFTTKTEKTKLMFISNNPKTNQPQMIKSIVSHYV